MALTAITLAIQSAWLCAMVIDAIWTGILKRPDFLGDMSEIEISREIDNGRFWGNIELYTLIFILLGIIALYRIFSLVRCIRGSLSRSGTCR
jgi:small-conductance mechanosensitive channel